MLRLLKASDSGATYVVWAVRDEDGQRVGTICKTGESRDNYPWDWSITADAPGVRRVTGVASSRAEALDELSAMWATRVTLTLTVDQLSELRKLIRSDSPAGDAVREALQLRWLAGPSRETPARCVATMYEATTLQQWKELRAQ